jgi:hypothetical protein
VPALRDPRPRFRGRRQLVTLENDDLFKAWRQCARRGQSTDASPDYHRTPADKATHSACSSSWSEQVNARALRSDFNRPGISYFGNGDVGDLASQKG